jgi:hypothetical protein
VATGAASSFFFLGRLFQGTDVRLELRNFSLIAFLRFPVLADFVGSLDGLTFPLVTTADDFRALKHWRTRTHREIDTSGFLSKFLRKFQRFLNVA